MGACVCVGIHRRGCVATEQRRAAAYITLNEAVAVSRDRSSKSVASSWERQAVAVSEMIRTGVGPSAALVRKLANDEAASVCWLEACCVPQWQVLVKQPKRLKNCAMSWIGSSRRQGPGVISSCFLETICSPRSLRKFVAKHTRHPERA